MRICVKYCPMCNFTGPSVGVILSHLRVIYVSDPNFKVTCGIDGCVTTFRSFSALYSHIYRKHPRVITKRSFANEESTGSYDMSIQCNTDCSGPSEQNSTEDAGQSVAAAHLLGGITVCIIGIIITLVYYNYTNYVL